MSPLRSPDLARSSPPDADAGSDADADDEDFSLNSDADLGAVFPIASPADDALAEMDSLFGAPLSKRAGPRRAPLLAPEVKELLEVSASAYVENDLVTAEASCLEAIRRAPHIPDGYVRLALIREDAGEVTHARALLQLAAPITPSGPARVAAWLRVAEMYGADGMALEAARSLQAAVRASKDFDSDLAWRLHDAFVEAGHPTGAQRALRMIVRRGSGLDRSRAAEDLIRDLSDAAQWTQARFADARAIATRVADADIAAIEAFRAHALAGRSDETLPDQPPSLSMNLLNMQLELEIDAAEPLAPSPEADRMLRGVVRRIERVRALTELPPELLCHLTVAHARLLQAKAAAASADELLRHDSGDNDLGDLFFAAAEAVSDPVLNMASVAVRLLVSTARSQHHGTATVHCALGKAVLAARMHPQAAEHAFRRALELDPSCAPAAVALARLLRSQGRGEAASLVLKAADASSPAVALEAGLQALSHGDTRSFSEALEPHVLTAAFFAAAFKKRAERVRKLLASDVRSNRLPTEEAYLRQVAAVVSTPPSPVFSAKASTQAARAPRDSRLIPEPAGADLISTVGTENWLALVRLLAAALARHGRLPSAIRLIYLTLKTPQLAPPESSTSKALTLLLVGLAAADDGASATIAFEQVRLLCNSRPHSVPLWSLLFRLAVQDGRERATNRVILRELGQVHDALPLALLAANFNLQSGSYSLALPQYVHITALAPHDALPLLLSAISLAHMVHNKATKNRAGMLTQMLAAIFAYAQLRGRHDPEAAYNIGRALHCAGMPSEAIPFYEAVARGSATATFRPVHAVFDHQLRLCPLPRDPQGEAGLDPPPPGDPPCPDLRPEAAHNLSLLYLRAGNAAAARAALRAHCTI
jgi:tetratricopeptide (TPR) repeat protein